MNKLIKNIETKKDKLMEYLTRLGDDFEHYNKLLSDENIDKYYNKDDRYSKN